MENMHLNENTSIPQNGIPSSSNYLVIPTETDRDTPNKLFLGGIPIQATEKELEEFFSQYGTVRDVRIVTDRITATCKGYGFVTFDENEDIEFLLQKKVVRMRGKKIRVRRAIPRHHSQFEHIRKHAAPVKAQALPPSNMVPRSSPPCPSPPQYYSPLTPPPSPEHQFSVMPAQVHSTYYMQPMPQPRIMAPMQPSEVFIPTCQCQPIYPPRADYGQFVYLPNHFISQPFNSYPVSLPVQSSMYCMMS